MNSAQLIRMLHQNGWYEVRRHGSHITFKHPSKPKLCTVPHPKKDLPLGTIRQILKNAELE
jgi:predicted RNA binding protein YcfA (HicA-like mRNA interferase family)